MTSGSIKLGMTPPHPGTFIQIEALEELGLSVAAAARILGVRRATLSDLVNGKASLSPVMALRVEKAFGLSVDLLLRMQAWHDTTQMRAPTRSTSGGIGRHERRRMQNFFNHASGGACGACRSKRLITCRKSPFLTV